MGVKEEAEAAWKAPGKALGPAAVGLAAVKGKQRGPSAKDIDTSAPSVEYKGFSKVDLNDRFYEKPDLAINGKPTYWTSDAQFFVYWQGDAATRWSICDAASIVAVKAGQLPGWAYKEDHKHLCQPGGWMEAWNGEWQEPSLEVVYRSSSGNPPQWDAPALQKAVSVIEFHGFTMKELNTRYFLRAGENIQGRPSYWDESGVYFIYWQQPMKRWAICDLKCLEAVKEGQCPGWAYRADAGFLANASGWMERRADEWTSAIIETSVIGICTKGLKVEFAGFAKDALNTTYTERPDEEIQGRVSFWDPTDMYFIYWQMSMQRWAICDASSLTIAKQGLAPGFAYRTDPAHFTRSRGWMEAWGRDWKRASVTCTVLEGNVRDDHHVVKSELQEEGAEPLTAEQYKMLLQRIYEDRNPSKLEDLDRLMSKYQGLEHELYKNVCEKYDVDAEAFAAQAPAASPAEAGDQDFAGLEDAGVPQLSAKEFAVLIQTLYVQYNPKKLQDIGALLQKYRHREGDLYEEACQKYGVHPAKFHAQNAAALQEQMSVKAESA
mmetsp:Transcript_69599/g.193663  ORF Transcript_69599/g.193663 Transcript_69599/m.193663 type:complete len:549 (+) Transcript_69599:1-1647(+)